MRSAKHQSARITYFRLIRGICTIFLALIFFLSPPLFTGRICDEFFSPFHEMDRKSIKLLQYRITSYSSMSLAELNMACIDPLKVLKNI
jgi:hypothetical protein